VAEAVALPEQGFVLVLRERVREAVPEVQPGRVAAVASEIPLCTPRQSCLAGGDIGDLDVECGEKIIEASCRARVVPVVQNDPELEASTPPPSSRFWASASPESPR